MRVDGTRLHPQSAVVATALVAVLGGACVVYAPLVAIGVLTALVVVGFLVATRIGPQAAGIAGLAALQVSIGPLYVTGALPKSTALALDVLALVLFASTVLDRDRPSAPRWLLLGFVGICVLQAFNPLLPSLTYATYGLRALTLPVITILAVAGARLREREVRFITIALVAAWALNLVFASRQWLVGFSPTELDWIQGVGSTYLVGDEVRLLGAQQSSQDFGYAAAVALPAAATLFLAARTTAARSLAAGLTAVTLVVLFATLVRSALVGGLVGAATVFVVARPPQQRRIALAAAAVIAFVLLLSAISPGTLVPEDKAAAVRARATSILQPGGDQAVKARRDETWPQAFARLREHPLGAGVGAAGPLTQRRDDAPFGAIVPDNGYLQIAVQLGLIGLAAFVAALLAMWRRLWQVARRGDLHGTAGLGALTALIVMMLAGGYWSLIGPATGMAVLVGLGLQERRAGSEAS